MNRLTENFLGCYQIKGCGNFTCEETCNNVLNCGCCPISEAINKLAEYEDLDEQGLLLRLPCKIGDIVYAIDGKNIQTLEAKDDIALISGKVCIFAENCHYADYISYDMIGKTVFLTQAEAEQKLK